MIKNKTLQIFICAFVAAFALFSAGCQSTTPAVSGSAEQPGSYEPIQVEKKYTDLKIQDLDQMSTTMFDKLTDYKKNDRPLALKEAVLIAFSRPNEDFVLEKIISPIRNQLDDIDEWDLTISQIVNQSIAILRDTQARPVDQVTAGVVLENMLSEFKPIFVKQYVTGGFETTVVEKIASANLEYNKKAMQEMKLNLMRQPASPSKIARNMLNLKKERQKK